jgi:hypothetical protein
MSSVPQVCQAMKTLIEEEAVPLAREAGLRERTLPFASLLLILVLGWWQHPKAGPSALARFAGSLGLSIKKQTVACHFRPETADWLLAVVRRGVQVVIVSQGVPIGLLQQFSGVFVEDGSSISLPAVLASVWKGCGGREASQKGEQTHAQAGLKLTVRLNLLTGALHGPYLQDGKAHEAHSPLQEVRMPPGSLWIADLGYWSLRWLHTLQKQGVQFLLHYKAETILWLNGERLDVLAWLQKQHEATSVFVDVGAARQVRHVRLLVVPVPDAVKLLRQARVRERAAREGRGKQVSETVLNLCGWTLLVTSVPEAQMSLEQALGLMRARWQIELLFKLWKEGMQIDEWQSEQPWRILCEVYAKLLAVLIQHWLLILACWDDPHRSWVGATEVLRTHVSVLAHGWAGDMPLEQAVSMMLTSVRGACSIPARRTRLNTARLLQHLSSSA